MKRLFTLFLLLFFFVPAVSAGKIKKGFQALEMYNYFEAKSLFEKSLKKEQVPAAYGLSLIYQRNDNPFFNLDSAYNFIIRAYKFFPTLSPKLRMKYAIYGVDSLSIAGHRELISGMLFQRARNENSVLALQTFIQMNYWSSDIDSAVYLRDKLAFESADAIGTSSEYDNFLKKYPTSVFADDANSRYEKELFLENTAQYFNVVC